jgi:hypothetical protein
LEQLGANDVEEQLLLSRPVATTTYDDMMVSASFPNVPNQKMPPILTDSTATSKKEAEELALLEAELAGMM